ncbi:MAG: hypothetical protein ACRET7_07285 [Burkholderiales bacterium]
MPRTAAAGSSATRWNGTGCRRSMLEGGYALHALGRSVATHIKVLGGL